MKALLVAINAKYIHSNLAVYNLKAYADANSGEKDSGTIRIAEYTINNQTMSILEGIYREKPHLLCFSCYIWNITMVEELIAEYHKLCPDVPIWVGGPEVSYEVETFLEEHPEVTGIMMGEGEKTFCEVYRYYQGYGESLAEIDGIAYHRGTEIAITKARAVMDMDEIPFCYGHIEDFKNKIIYYETSRGCPFRCSYCLSSVEKQLRFRSFSLVKKELAYFLEKEVAQVKFVDRTFNCDHKHAMEVWSFIKEHDNGITNFHFEISADLLTEEELALLASMRPGTRAA